jgi:aromatic-amino-acid transaminase
MFQHLEPYAGDPILGLVEAFHRDPRPHKVNLSIGIYFDDAGRIPVLDCVREAEAQMLASGEPKPYLPIEGAAPMREAVQKLLFGDHEALRQGRVATIQTIGASGALKVGADLLHRWLPQAQVWLSRPSWDNHRAMFEGAGITVNEYPYYDNGPPPGRSQGGPAPSGGSERSERGGTVTSGLDFDGMCATLDRLPARSIVLLHACCHNPTGVDLSMAQWQRVVELVRSRELLPFLDVAYQGFGDGIEEDVAPVRLLASSGLPFIVSHSFSKNLSVYGERCGALSVVCSDASEAQLVLGQLKATVRRNYSSPGIHAAGIVARVLTDPKLRPAWERDVAAMRSRILEMRRQLHAVLAQRLPGRDFGYFLSQRGMFSYTGLSAAQVDRLREEHAVYLVRSGRMCIAGLTTSNVGRAGEAFATVLAAG